MKMSFVGVASVAAATLIGCNLAGNAQNAEGTGTGSGDELANSGGTRSTSAPGHVAFHLVDAPADVTSVVVTVAHLDANVASSGWQTIVAAEQEVDLLTLQGGHYLDLGLASLPVGRVHQLRLYLAEGKRSYVTTSDGVEHTLRVPSGTQSGIKLVGSFDVPACAGGVVTIDFDAKRSLHLHPVGGAEDDAGNGNGQGSGGNGQGSGGNGQGSGGNGQGSGEPEAGTAGGPGFDWVLRPVIRVRSVSLRSECAPAETDAASHEAGAEPPATDAGDVGDPCATIECSEAEVCENGSCRPAELP